MRLRNKLLRWIRLILVMVGFQLCLVHPGAGGAVLQKRLVTNCTSSACGSLRCCRGRQMLISLDCCAGVMLSRPEAWVDYCAENIVCAASQTLQQRPLQ